MQISNYKLHANNPQGLTPVSADQASEMINKFNIYFRIYAVPTDEYGYRNFDFDLIDHNIYKMDNLKSFDDQYSNIKSIHFTFDSTVYFYTDYKEAACLVHRRLELASQILKSKSKSITVTNLKNETKLSKDEINIYIDSLEKNKTESLFDLDHEGVSPNGRKEKNYKQLKGVSTEPISSFKNVSLCVDTNRSLNGVIPSSKLFPIPSIKGS